MIYIVIHLHSEISLLGIYLGKSVKQRKKSHKWKDFHAPSFYNRENGKQLNDSLTNDSLSTYDESALL